MSNITIQDFPYTTVCDFEGRGRAKYSIGIGNEPSVLRKLVCHDCLIGIITEGLKMLTEEERTEILKDYITQEEKTVEQTKTDETKGKKIDELTRQELIDLAIEKKLACNPHMTKSVELIKMLKAAD